MFGCSIAPRPDGMRCFSSGCGRRMRSLTLACRRPRQALTQRDGWGRRGPGRRAWPAGRFMRVAPGRPGRHLPGARLAGGTWMYARQREPGSRAQPCANRTRRTCSWRTASPAAGRSHVSPPYTDGKLPQLSTRQAGASCAMHEVARTSAYDRPTRAHSRPDHRRAGRNAETDPAAYPWDGRAGPGPGHPGLAQASFRRRLSRPSSKYNLAHSRLSRAY
jgi:hypothetical protein